jgi:hypothetical protein
VHARDDDGNHSSLETSDRRRKFVSRSRMVAIWRRRKKSMNPHGHIKISSRGGSSDVGGVAGDGWSWPKRVSDAIATVSPGVRVRVARERETSGVGRLDQIPTELVWFG